jgi:riboflavin synthase
VFTGIVEAVGTLVSLEPRAGDRRAVIDAGAMSLEDVAIGDSVAVNGVCLTAVELRGSAFAADVSGETLERTAFGRLRAGTPVNLEKALTPSSRLGGHLVTGHVDGLGEVVSRAPAARSVQFSLQAPDGLARYIAEKGSICVDGVSLTVNAVQGSRFDLNIVPHTLERTTLGSLAAGDLVNLEVDIVARYLERLLLGPRASESGAGLTREFLAEHGFWKD